MGKEAKFILRIEEADRALRVEKEVSEALKGAVSAKMLSKMKREYVECPIAGGKIPFLRCFACVSFIRRVMGYVHCSGEEFKLKI